MYGHFKLFFELKQKVNGEENMAIINVGINLLIGQLLSLNKAVKMNTLKSMGDHQIHGWAMSCFFVMGPHSGE